MKIQRAMEKGSERAVAKEKTKAVHLAPVVFAYVPNAGKRPLTGKV
jgi:hypothetical protein